MYRPHTKATIVILLIHIIDKYKEHLAGIFVQCCNFWFLYIYHCILFMDFAKIYVYF